MRICIVSKGFPPATGGGETYAFELAEALGERGHDVDVYTQRVDGRDNNVSTNQNVTVFRLSGVRKWLGPVETLYFSLFARIKIDFDDYDVVHGTLMPASTIAMIGACGLRRTPLVLTSHGTSIDEVRANQPACVKDYVLKYAFHPSDVVMDYIAGQQADRIIAISSHSYDGLVDSYGFNGNKIERVLHGVDTNRFHPDNEHHPEVDRDCPTLLFVGRLGPRKGLNLLLESLSEISQVDYECLIAGSGRHEPLLRQRCAELEITDKVRFLGHVSDDDLPSLYSSVDVFILPSTYEGFGLVLLEAMSSGTPVIASDVGGIPSVVDDGHAGFVVPRRVNMLKRKIEYLLTNELDRLQMGENARSHAMTLSWSEIASQIESLYQDLLSEEN